ncbi:cytoskeleton protein RodZ [Providencia manganoxydans]|uniref:Cytoskeleton protein RodZ n=1 Tax=Providencia manganoxydans TaxID=2923283 RepID=A0ABX7AKF8_9GAMM|nr:MULTISPECIES: cytoskeleton protein RodZ [Providencia]MDX4944521.1 cytoskeleton protein RodZ [Providencia manganoxydans]QQO63779.1 cytoskeleton protein RodZ [Providencia manganoxydans]HEF8771530.1 cytoskeleton protein RodZ [Providencia stuartii]
MTIDNNTEQTPITVGKLLSQARERMGLTQEAVAERLCLKVSTVREIDEDIKPAGVEPTFLRGYMRLYARMVNVAESELNALLKTGEPIAMSTVSPMQSYSLGKKRKKREGWLMKVTWLIVILLIAMVGVWWWQDHQAQKSELTTMANQNDLILSQQNNVENSTESPSDVPDNSAINAPLTAESTPIDLAPAQPIDTQVMESQPVKTVPLPNASNTTVTVDRAQTHDEPEAAPVVQDALVMSFKGPCWLEVRDANNKILFSGTKNNGDKLDLQGTPPYRLNIGAPANVDAQFNGNVVDLSRFIKANRPAKLKVPEA